MAHLNADELVDWIRHQFRTEDDTGICCRVLPRPTRPTTGARGVGEDSSDDSDEELDEDEDLEAFYSRHFDVTHLLPALYDPDGSVSSHLKASPSQFRRQCQPGEEPNLDERRKGGESGSTLKVVHCADQRPTSSSTSSNAFFPTRVPRKLPHTTQSATSMTARLLSDQAPEDIPSTRQRFEEYARFEALPGASASKLITIVIPWASATATSDTLSPQKEYSRCCVMPMQVVNTARISDLVGLVCYNYSRRGLEPPCLSPRHYSLYLAEEDCDYDTELPPQDPHRLVADCGFPYLALILDEHVPQYAAAAAAHSNRIANVYLTDGRKYEIQLESVDVPLQWLFDEAIERRAQETQGRRRHEEYITQLPYLLEPLGDEAGDSEPEPLKLSLPVSNAGTMDFLLRRVNSSRGELLQANRRSSARDHMAPLTPSSPLALQVGQQSRHNTSPTPTPTNNSHLASPTSPTKNFASTLSFDVTPTMVENAIQTTPVSEEVGRYAVERLHRIKPKWPALVLIRRDNYVEVVPRVQDYLRRQLSSGSQLNETRRSRVEKEVLRIHLGQIAHIEVISTSERGATRRVVKVVWLKFLAGSIEDLLVTNGSGQLADGQRKQSMAFQHHLAQLLTEATWKTLQLEAGTDEAWKLASQLNDLIGDGNSQFSLAHLIYEHSERGSKRPLQAAGYALNMPFDHASTQTRGSVKQSKSATNLERTHSVHQHRGWDGTLDEVGEPKVRKKKFSMITSASAVFTRMLSRQE